MLSQHTTIIGLNRCDGIFPMSDGGMSMKISDTSIPFFYPVYLSSLFPKVLCCLRREMSLVLMISLKFHSKRERSLKHSMAYRRCRTALTLAMEEAKLEFFYCHDFNILLRFLNFAVIAFVGSGFSYSKDQPCSRIGIKSSLSSQWFSNLKILPLGILVSISTIHGQWSDVSMTRDFTTDFGYLTV